MRIIGKIIFVIASFFIVVGFSFLLLRYQSNRPLQAVTTNSNFSQHALSVYDSNYVSLYHQYGLDLPPFYFSMSNMALPDSLKYLPASDEKDFLIYWSCKTGNAKALYNLYQSLCTFHNKSWMIHPSQILNLQRFSSQMVASRNIDTLNFYYANYNSLLPQESKTFTVLNGLKEINVNAAWKQWVPTFHINTNNQFALWLNDLLNNRTGIYSHSWISKTSVGAVLKTPMLITFTITVITMLIIVIFSVVFSAELFLKKGKKGIRNILHALHFLYSIPSFFIGALLVFVFANPYQLQILPANFSFAPLVENDSISLISLLNSWTYFILPVITLSFGAIVFFTLMLFRSFEEEFSKNYVLSAKMMGQSNRTIVYKFVLKNAVYSSSTFLFLLFPALLSGAVVVEQMFSIAGIGNLLITAARSQDVPILISLFGIIGLVTSLSFILLDYFQQKIVGRLLTNKEVKE
jgi:peptide/nickel transport system permease protein